MFQGRYSRGDEEWRAETETDMSEQMMTGPRSVTAEERPFWETVARLYREYGTEETMEEETAHDHVVEFIDGARSAPATERKREGKQS
jgi:hypothetical protein